MKSRTAVLQTFTLFSSNGEPLKDFNRGGGGSIPPSAFVSNGRSRRILCEMRRPPASGFGISDLGIVLSR